MQCPLGTSLQNHHGLAMQLQLRHPSPAFSVLTFCNCSLPHSFRPTEDDGCLLPLPSSTAPPLKLYLYLAYTFYTFPFIKLSSNYPIYTCHLFIAWTLPGTGIELCKHARFCGNTEASVTTSSNLQIPYYFCFTDVAKQFV